MRDDLDRADAAKDEAKERPNRAQLILNAKRIRAELGQFLDDVRYWNHRMDHDASDDLWLPSELFDVQPALDMWLDTDAATYMARNRTRGV